jgi:hypothetical protein
MSAPTIAELHEDPRFAVLYEIGHADIATALRPYLYDLAVIPIAYWLANVAVLAWLVSVGYASELGLLHGVWIACLGVTIAWLVLLPVHEWIHAAAYRAIGAKQVAVTYRLRSLTAFCTADRFVASGGRFVWVCIAPSIALNLPLAAAVLMTPEGSIRLALCGALLFHLSAASGDIALINLVRSVRDGSVWTYDDLAAARTLFFAEASNHKAGRGSDLSTPVGSGESSIPPGESSP